MEGTKGRTEREDAGSRKRESSIVKGAWQTRALIALGVVVGLVAGLVYGQVRLHGEQKLHQAKLREINQRLTQIQHRLGQGMAALEEEKQAIEARADGLLKEKERLASENKGLKTKADSLAASMATLEKGRASSEARAASCETKSAQLTERLTKTEAARDELDRTQKQTFRSLQDREKDLKTLDKKYDQCAEHNVRLYGISGELLKRYEQKGILGTMLQKEPFTQIKKVELEKLVQDYKERIDRQRAESK